ncbi:hypothetical protein LguiB_030884 [Lonicera macranthoides]
MAFLLSPSLILSFSVSVLLIISPAISLTCTSQNFTNNLKFANCSDLSSLGAYLHWTYDTAKNSLSIAFIAPLAEPSGWIAWGINPTSTGMLGTQSLLAFKQSDGSMVVDTYNISSYYSITPSKILFNVSNLRAEDSGGITKIFATLALPQNTREVFQVWQVGFVTDGMPDGHEMQPENMNAKGTLRLVVEAQRNGTDSVNDRSTTNSNTDGERESTLVKGGISMISKESNAVFCVCMLVLGILALF